MTPIGILLVLLSLTTINGQRNEGRYLRQPSQERPCSRCQDYRKDSDRAGEDYRSEPAYVKPRDEKIDDRDTEVREEYDHKPSAKDDYNPKPPLREDYELKPPLRDGYESDRDKRKPEPSRDSYDSKPKSSVRDTYNPKPEPSSRDTYNPKPDSSIRDTYNPKPDSSIRDTYNPKLDSSIRDTYNPKPDSSIRDTYDPKPDSSIRDSYNPKPDSSIRDTYDPKPDLSIRDTYNPKPDSSIRDSYNPKPDSSIRDTYNPRPESSIRDTYNPKPDSSIRDTYNPKPDSSIRDTYNPRPESSIRDTYNPKPSDRGEYVPKPIRPDRYEPPSVIRDPSDRDEYNPDIRDYKPKLPDRDEVRENYKPRPPFRDEYNPKPTRDDDMPNPNTRHNIRDKDNPAADRDNRRHMRDPRPIYREDKPPARDPKPRPSDGSYSRPDTEGARYHDESDSKVDVDKLKVKLPVANSNCICVPYYQCKSGHIVTDGDGIIDARRRPQHDEELPLDGKFRPPSCGPFHVCCNTPESSTVKPYEHRCGVRNPSGINSRILSPSNKGEADFGEWPWQAAVLKTEGSVNIFQCGGVLIDKFHVITVAHCVFHLSKYRDIPLKVRLGEWDTQTYSEFLAHEDYKVSKIAIHDEYRNASLWNDIAILKLQDPVAFAPHIDTVCLPQHDDIFAGQNCVVTGWGKDSYKGGSFSNVMKEVALQVIDSYTCEEMLRKTRLGRFFQLYEGFLCAGGEDGLDACKGDGGGPLVCYKKDRSYALAGIVSWGVDCGQQEVPGVYVKVQKYLNWISKITGLELHNYWTTA